MEKFLQLNPQYKQQSEVLQMIKRKVLFKNIPDLNSYLTVFKLPLFKELIKKDFYSSKELKETYSEIIKKETNPVEKMIFKMLNNKRICFSDYKLHFLFYKEFPQFIHLFSSDGSYEMEDFLFRKIYLHIDIDDDIQRKIEKSSFLNQIFYIISLHSCLNSNFIKNRLLDLKNDIDLIKKNEEISDSDFVHNWIIGIRCLPSPDFYSICSSELLYSSYIDKINFYRGLEEIINHEKLSIYMLNDCFSNPLSVVKTYIVFLKVIELFNLNYDFKLKLLYSWLRFFLIENHLDLFLDLIKHLKKSKKLSPEFDIYLSIEKYLANLINFEEMEEFILNYEDSNTVSTIKLKEIVDRMKA